MKICLLAGASSIHTMRWANAFANKGFKVDLITAHKPILGYDKNIIIHLLPFKIPLGYFLNAPLVKRLLKQIKPDIVNSHYASGYGTLGRLSGFHPLVLNVWGSDVYEFPETSYIHRKIILANFRSADHICSTSKIMAQRVKSLWPEVTELSVTPFGVDCNHFSPNSEILEKNEIVIGTVKTMAPKYGIKTLVKAFAEALILVKELDDQTAKKMRLRIVGDGPERFEIEELVNLLDISSITTLVGQVPNHYVPRELRKLDIYCALSESESESFGVAIVEASACALPVVVSKIGGLVEVTQNNETGFQIEKGNINEASKAIVQLVCDSNLRKKLGISGRLFVLREFEWNENVERMIGIFNSVLSKKNVEIKH